MYICIGTLWDTLTHKLPLELISLALGSRLLPDHEIFRGVSFSRVPACPAHVHVCTNSYEAHNPDVSTCACHQPH